MPRKQGAHGVVERALDKRRFCCIILFSELKKCCQRIYEYWRPTIIKSDQSTVRTLNRLSVLNLLRQRGTLSRQELSSLTGLSSAAMSGVVGELMRDGLVLEVGDGEAKRGRPPILLDIAYGAHFVAGVKIMEGRLELVLTDLHTEVLASAVCGFSERTPASVVRHIATCVRALLKERGADKLVGAGLGMPGVIDSDTGVCRYSPILGWRDAPVGAMLEAELSCPVWADNDVNAFSVAEQLFGRGRRADNFLVVTVGRGIGAALVLGGNVYRGHAGGAGEFGHTVIEVGGRPCECGKRGCLEAYAAEPAILAQAERLEPQPRTIEQLVHLAEDGHEEARTLLAEAGSKVGVGLSNLVNVFNPELVVIGGEGVRLGENYFDPLRDALTQNAFDGLAADLPLYIDPWGDDAWARGAAALVIQKEVFTDPKQAMATRNNESQSSQSLGV